jgi:hypothetical protein
LLIDNTAKAHLPGPQNPGECRLYLAEGCHLYIALTKKSRSPGCYGKFTSSQSSEGLSEGDIIIVNVRVVVCWKSYNAFCTPQNVVVGHYREVVIARVQYPKCPALVVIPVV